MLFWADRDPGRSEEMRRFVSSENLRGMSVGATAESYSSAQFQYMLVLMLIISIAEKRTQELYKKEFAERCDAISKDHRLQDDRYWEKGQVPAEWETLNQEFEEQSLRILSETLREYKQDDIADLIETEGAQQLFDIVESVRSQFFKVLEGSSGEGRGASKSEQEGSIPETLHSSEAPSKGKRKRRESGQS